MPVTFKESDHSYTSHTGEKYISVTQLIKLYTPPFDSDYWSAYKAIKDVMNANGDWYAFKRAAGGWETVVEYARRLSDKGEMPHVDLIIQRKNEYLKQWREKGESASAKGRKFHMAAQVESGRKVHITETLQEIPVLSGVDILAVQDFTGDGIYTELLLYNDDYKLAGQADWVMKSGRKVSIKDYKTNEEMSTEGFRGETLLYPLNELPNSKLHVYSIQLMLYGWLLEQRGYEVQKLIIEHVISESDRKSYPVQYNRKLVKDLVNHYADKQREKSRRKAYYETRRKAG